MKPYPVFIEWDDACDVGESWMSLDDFEVADVAPCGVVSVGWCVQESDSAFLLALSISEFGDCRQVFTVPRSAVKTMTRLVPGD